MRHSNRRIAARWLAAGELIILRVSGHCCEAPDRLARVIHFHLATRTNSQTPPHLAGRPCASMTRTRVESIGRSSRVRPQGHMAVDLP